MSQDPENTPEDSEDSSQEDDVWEYEYEEEDSEVSEDEEEWEDEEDSEQEEDEEQEEYEEDDEEWEEVDEDDEDSEQEEDDEQDEYEEDDEEWEEVDEDEEDSEAEEDEEQDEYEEDDEEWEEVDEDEEDSEQEQDDEQEEYEEDDEEWEDVDEDEEDSEQEQGEEQDEYEEDDEEWEEVDEDEEDSEAEEDEEQEESEEDVSLNALSNAFASMMEEGTEDPKETEGEHEDDEAEEDAIDWAAVSAPDMTGVDPHSVVEAMLFVGNNENIPLSAELISSLIRGVEESEVAEIINDLNEGYKERNAPYRIFFEEEGYRLILRNEFQSVRERFYGKARQAKLSQAAIEVLAIIAYQQPMEANDISKLRDASSGSIVKQLLKRQLLRAEKDPEDPKKTYYYTTDRFLDLYHLESLDDLPRWQDPTAM